MRRRFATLFVSVVPLVLVGNLSACREEAKEDPAEERQREVQQQVEQPEQTQPRAGEQTDRTVGGYTRIGRLGEC